MLCAACWSRNLSDLLIVSQAFVEHQDGVSLHPDLLLWQEALSRYRRRWFDCAARNPLAWYAELTETAPAALLAAAYPGLPLDITQCWVASPYHAGLARTAVRVMPEGQFPWSASDAEALCAQLNPLLIDEGMELFAVGAAILCGCREPIEAFPQGFGRVAGFTLPDRHHEGTDGGRLNRLLSEIQMLLFQHPIVARHERGEPEVSGIWLWAPIPRAALDDFSRNSNQLPAVATRNPVLHAVADGKDAAVTISEAERVDALLSEPALLPKRIVLAGSAHAVLLKRSVIPRMGAAHWQPEKSKSEAELFAMLRALI